MADTPNTKPAPESRATAASEEALASEDFYLDGPFMVFTSAYHLRRGFCCGSVSRHAPDKPHTNDRS